MVGCLVCQINNVSGDNGIGEGMITRAENDVDEVEGSCATESQAVFPNDQRHDQRWEMRAIQSHGTLSIITPLKHHIATRFASHVRKQLFERPIVGDDVLRHF
jgi:hypothetical protein